MSTGDGALSICMWSAEPSGQYVCNDNKSSPAYNDKQYLAGHIAACSIGLSSLFDVQGFVEKNVKVKGAR